MCLTAHSQLHRHREAALVRLRGSSSSTVPGDRVHGQQLARRLKHALELDFKPQASPRSGFQPCPAWKMRPQTTTTCKSEVMSGGVEHLLKQMRFLKHVPTVQGAMTPGGAVLAKAKQDQFSDSN